MVREQARERQAASQFGGSVTAPVTVPWGRSDARPTSISVVSVIISLGPIEPRPLYASRFGSVSRLPGELSAAFVLPVVVSEASLHLGH